MSCVLARGLGHRDLDRELGEVGQELVQRRVEQAHGDRQPVHGLEDLDEVGPLQRQQLVEDDLPLLGALGQDQPLDELAALAEEHVLGAAQADALGAEPAGAGGIRRVVGVGPHLHPAVPVGDGHQPVDGGDDGAALVDRHGALEVAHDGGGAHGDLAEEDLTGRAVDGEGVALAHDGAVGRGELLGLGVDLEGLGAAHAGAAHAAGHDGRVRGLAATAGEDAGRGHHAVQVVGVGLAAHEDDGGALRGDPHGGVRVEDGHADGRAGGGAHPLGEQRAGALGVEVREHQLGELVTGDPHQGLLLGDDALVDEVDRDAEGGLGGALPDPGLQHPQLALLDGELDVAHVAVVALEAGHDVEQLVVALRVDALEVGEGAGCCGCRRRRPRPGRPAGSRRRRPWRRSTGRG